MMRRSPEPWGIDAAAEALDASVGTALAALGGHHPAPTPGTVTGATARDLWRLFQSQVASRHIDFAARWLQMQGRGYYTIGSAGHEANGAIGLLSEVTDPALLHYRSGALYLARSGRAGHSGSGRDILRGVAASTRDPISGGRHKVFGHAALHVIPQTSTIASHLPRAVGLAFALGTAARLGRRTPWPDDSVVICSLGDASVNHSTAVGAFNTAAYLTHRGIDCPILFVCEDNGIGISTRSPAGWVESALQRYSGISYTRATGDDPVALLTHTRAAIAASRASRGPAILHLKTVRFLGHAGSDVEQAYRSTSEIAGERARDPILHTGVALVAGGYASADELVQEYDAARRRAQSDAAAVLEEPQLGAREEVMRPLIVPRATGFSRAAETPVGPARTLAQAINGALAAVLEEDDGALVFGEDVARKGGVYGVTRGLQRAFGGVRVFDTVLDEQTVLGTALGAALAGFLPIPEIQYLAYVHNAEDQIRGEAASLAFFSQGQYRNGMVVRIAGLAYQRGFGGHFHNDHSLAVLRDIPGIVIAVPASPADAAGMLRTCVDLSRAHGTVCVFVEPIARYHTRDLEDGDGRWSEPVDLASRTPFGMVRTYGDDAELSIVTFGNGVHLSLRARARLHTEGIAARVIDLRWLAPLPEESLISALSESERVLIVDETRTSGGVGDSVSALLGRRRPDLVTDTLTAADSFVPLGPAADEVLVSVDEILQRGRALAATRRASRPATRLP